MQRLYELKEAAKKGGLFFVSLHGMAWFFVSADAVGIVLDFVERTPAILIILLCGTGTPACASDFLERSRGDTG